MSGAGIRSHWHELQETRYPLALYARGLEERQSPWGKGGFFHLPELPSGVVQRTSCYPEIAADLVCLRVLAPAGGWLGAETLELLATCAERFGLQLVQFSTGGTIEVFVPLERAVEAVSFLNAGGLDVGSSGDDLRAITSCCGPARCDRAVVDAPALATYLGQEFMEDQQYPSFIHKVKMAVAGCPCDCIRAAGQKDIALIGMHRYGAVGIKLVVGGKYGCRGLQGPMVGREVVGFLPLVGDFTPARLLVGRLLDFWNDHGQRKERMGDFLVRVGVEAVRQAMGLETEEGAE